MAAKAITRSPGKKAAKSPTKPARQPRAPASPKKPVKALLKKKAPKQATSPQKKGLLKPVKKKALKQASPQKRPAQADAGRASTRPPASPQRKRAAPPMKVAPPKRPLIKEDCGETLCYGAPLKGDTFRTAKSEPLDKVNTVPERKANATAVVIWLHAHARDPKHCELVATMDLRRTKSGRKKDGEDGDDDSEEEELFKTKKRGGAFKSYLPEDHDFGLALGTHVRWCLPPADLMKVDLPQYPKEGKYRFWFALNKLPVGIKKDGGADEPQQLAANVKKVHALINHYVKLGIPEDRIVLGGFGQGGAMAAVAALRYRKTLAAVVVQNGWIPLCEEQTVKKRKEKMPFFFSEGRFDHVVDVSYKQRTETMLRNNNYKLWHIKAWFGMHHDAILIRRRVLEFLSQAIPKSTKDAPAVKDYSYTFDEPEEKSKWPTSFDLDNLQAIRGL